MKIVIGIVYTHILIVFFQIFFVKAVFWQLFIATNSNFVTNPFFTNVFISAPDIPVRLTGVSYGLAISGFPGLPFACRTAYTPSDQLWQEYSLYFLLDFSGIFLYVFVLMRLT